MKRIGVAVLIVSLAPLLFSACKTSSSSIGNKTATPPAYMTEAVLRSFKDIFDGSWGGVTIYVQRSAWVPDDFKKIGSHSVEVTSVRDLISKNEDADVAPAIAIVDANQNEEGIIRVTIKYTPVRIKGLEPATKGGTFEYNYQMIDDKLIMISRLKPLI